MQLKENEIKKVLDQNRYNPTNIILQVLKIFNFKTICNNAGFIKKDGYEITEILFIMILMPLSLLNSVTAFLASDFKNITEMQKDAIYRTKNNENYSWRRLIYAIVKKYKQLTGKTSEEELTTAIIIDDTADMRTGYKIENVSCVFNHTTHKTGYGYKNLVAVYHDGKSSIPIDFELKTEKKLIGKKGKKQYKKKCKKNSPGNKRRKECGTNKITSAIKMIKRAVKNGIHAKYVLADSWFGTFRFIKAIKGIKGKQVVCGIKRDKKKYGYNGGQYNLKQIINILKIESKPRRNKKWHVLYYEILVEYPGIGKVKMYICRFPYQKEWRVFLSTEEGMDFNRMMEVYTIRWTIEVIFREMKQFLGLGKCKSQDFDAQIANVSISFLLYIFLAYYRRMRDYESIGGLFEKVKNDLIEKNLMERLWKLFDELIDIVISALSKFGKVDMAKFKLSKEYIYIKELFENSFLGNQMKKFNNAA